MNKPTRRLAAAAVLAAAAALSSVVAPGVANAAQLGWVEFLYWNDNSQSLPNSGSWARGWDTCRQHYPATRSIRYVSHSGLKPSWMKYNCYNSTNGT